LLGERGEKKGRKEREKGGDWSVMRHCYDVLSFGWGSHPEGKKEEKGKEEGAHLRGLSIYKGDLGGEEGGKGEGEEGEKRPLNCSFSSYPLFRIGEKKKEKGGERKRGEEGRVKGISGQRTDDLYIALPSL